jgi:demethylmenaquinone methyltransferase/2-methoxy-6-polyprenyl-1,4-benzoquinol methylase
MNKKNTTHFGFKTVLSSDKASLVQDVFTNVASNYDLMNDLMSLGIHRLWKDALIDWLNPQPGQQLLDVAGGTGDISFRFIKRAKGTVKATVLDMTEAMLVEGKKRSETENLSGSLEWVCGDAMSLPFKNNSFDVYTISFGIRNVTDMKKAIAEAFRVLKIGGRITVLEFGQMPDELLQKVYNKYSFNVIPELGRLIAGEKKSYQYLVESIRKFPKQDDFSKLLKSEGFENVKYRNMSLGIAAIHSGWKV